MKDNSDTEKIVTCLVLTVLFPFLAIGFYFLNGWVLSLLWKWFIVTTFGLEPLNIAQAIGIAIIVGFLTKNSGDYKKEERQGWEMIIPVLGAFVAPFLTLLTGYIIYIMFIVN